MIYCLYNVETNTLLGISADPHAVQDGQSEVPFHREMPDLTIEEWNPAVLNFFTKTDVPISKLIFMKRFTAAEYKAIKNAAATNGDVDFFWQKFLTAQDIVLSDPELIVGLNTLEQFGILAPGRAAEILA